MLPVAALIDGVERPPPGVVGVSAERPLAVLDVAAAPGGKTTQLAAWLRARGEGGLVVANERSSSRLASLVANAQRLALAPHVVAVHGDGRALGAAAPEAFDAVTCFDRASRGGPARAGVSLAASRGGDGGSKRRRTRPNWRHF